MCVCVFFVVVVVGKVVSRLVFLPRRFPWLLYTSAFTIAAHFYGPTALLHWLTLPFYALSTLTVCGCGQFSFQ